MLELKAAFWFFVLPSTLDDVRNRVKNYDFSDDKKD